MARLKSDIPEVEFPAVFFGEVGEPGADWRKLLADDKDIDEDADGPTPPEVIEILGFDPRTLYEEGRKSV